MELLCASGKMKLPSEEQKAEDNAAETLTEQGSQVKAQTEQELLLEEGQMPALQQLHALCQALTANSAPLNRLGTCEATIQ